MQKKNTQFGRTMVEMLAVLIIIGIISIGGLAGFKQATSKYKINKIHTDIQTINADTVSLLSWQRSYEIENSQQLQQLLCTNKIYPDGCDSSNVAINPFGGKYTVTTTKNTMTIKATDIPIKECAKLKNLEWKYLLEKDGNPSCDGTESNKTFKIIFE